MRIYKDILTNDEMFTDVNKVELVDDCIYEVTCNFVTRKQGEIVIDGANPSAEGEDADDAGGDGQVESGLDLVLNQRLSKIEFSKDDYKNYLKTYSKALQEKWKEMEFTDAQIDESKKKIMQAAKIVMPKLKDAEFYVGESMNPDGMIAILEYRSKPDGTEDNIMMFFSAGLEAEKV